MKTKKIAIQIGGFLFLFLCVLFLIFKKLDINSFFIIIKQAEIRYLILGLLFMFCYIICEAINMYQVLKDLKEKISFFKTVKYAVIGFFFSAITPSSSGGQPMQLYAMNKDHVEMAHGTIALLLQITSYQMIICILGTIGFLFHYPIIIETTGNIKYFLILGMLINLIILGVLFAFLFCKKILYYFEKWGKKIAIFLKLKKIDSFLVNLKKQVDEYQSCTLYLKKNKKLWLKIIGVTFFQIFFSYSIPFLISLTLKVESFSFCSFFFMQAALFFSVSALPLPGSIGVGEGIFLVLFQLFFSPSFLNSAMLLTRFINFYAMVVITGGILFFLFVWNKRKKSVKKIRK